ncbi:MAG: aldo/keto reductase [Clostridia bacterium]|nr:aldo/keto reductase [Clostridia bacterium]
MKKLGFGCMRLPLADKKDDSAVDIEQVKEMVDAYLKEGFNYFDTAYMYHKGKSERFVKEALVKRHPRDSFYLADKLPVGMMKKAEDKETIFLDQKEKCGVDYFDYYLLHCLDKKNFKAAEKYGVFEYLAERKKAGEIRVLGFSFHDTADVLDDILTKHPEMEFVQLQINYLDWENKNVQSRKCYEVARKHGTPIIVMEPVRGGALANVPAVVKNMFREKDESLSVASWAIRFTASLDGVFMVLSGMSDMAQLKDNMGYMKDFIPLTDEEKELCLKAGSIIANKDTVPCTACRYCAEECPERIAIPELLALYNRKINGEDVTADDYSSVTKESSPESCIKCKKCEKMCPQKIEIARMMKTVAKKFR